MTLKHPFDHGYPLREDMVNLLYHSMETLPSMCGLPACMSVHHACAPPVEAKRGCQIFWDWGY